jgi:hypothetical protein
MKKIYSRLILLAIAVFLFGFAKNAVAQENLLVNGDMEIWQADTLAGYNIDHDSTVVTQQTGDYVHGGTSSAKCVVTLSNTSRALTDFGHSGIIIDSAIYDLSCWAYQTTSNVYFTWVINDATHGVFGSSGGVANTNYNIVNDWQRLRFQLDNRTGSFDTVNVFHRFYENPAKTHQESVIYIDDESMMKHMPNAELADIQVIGESIPDFDPMTTHYSFPLPTGYDGPVPEITVMPMDTGLNVTSGAWDSITPATDLMGDSAARTTTILVTADDSTTTMMYTVTFYIVPAQGIGNNLVNKIKVYPVPATDQITVSGLVEKDTQFSIMDITGRTVKNIKSTGRETTVNISDLHPGYYFVRVYNKTMKFVKE